MESWLWCESVKIHDTISINWFEVIYVEDFYPAIRIRNFILLHVLQIPICSYQKNAWLAEIRIAFEKQKMSTILLKSKFVGVFKLCNSMWNNDRDNKMTNFSVIQQIPSS